MTKKKPTAEDTQTLLKIEDRYVTFHLTEGDALRLIQSLAAQLRDNSLRGQGVELYCQTPGAIHSTGWCYARFCMK